ncbi:biotin carboxylase N-terminal domain-containing protein [Arthrobacter sp. SDTb3-6]|uniref:acetyl/propionyl/methylcrotonyl-CoA carboxylase subunit alpha n=1 Tax=Arthrobacter sp. SDTb3-6 TaxID=2713571 RepID=UPI00159D65BE|nr:biotin carboxylase N-terminal domain-containing protein [Arthrobacter sp. SDTb3-6]NVM97707.1 biotin/lipoyl-binding protein [Arthrobacter sp. SDTb3-6]
MTSPFDSSKFSTVLVANRGEIACRVIRTLRTLGLRSVAVYSEADAGARHVREADTAVCLGPAAASESYLNIDAVLAACRASGAQAVHPGYGFLSENVAFARALADAGITFIGPNIKALDVMGDKIRSKNHVAAAGVPVVPGISEPGLTDADLIAAAAGIGFPVLIKPSAGGGGKGMHAVWAPAELPATLATARRVAAGSFGDDTLFLERLVSTPRHIEVQVLGDGFGNVIHLGERECSLQRRHQKVIEEAPSPLLDSLPDGAAVRERIGAAACAAAASVDYTGAGTVEFLVSNDNPDEFFFMEMNTRLQVEHPVTEMVVRANGQPLDLVEWQLRIAAGEKLTVAQSDVELLGHAVEARVYAENPAQGFLPSAGTVALLDESIAGRDGVRVDSSLLPGLEISANYDPMLAKVIAAGAGREQALARLDAALGDYVVLGVPTNIEFLRLLLADPDVQAGRLDTNLIERKLPAMEFRTLGAADYAAAALWSRSRGVGRGLGSGVPGPGVAAGSPWGRTDGWRLGDPAPWRVACAGPGRTGVVTVSGTEGSGVVHVTGPGGDEGPGHRAGLAHAQEGRLELPWDGERRHYQAVFQDGAVVLGSGGWSARVPVLSRGEATARMLAGIEQEDQAASPEVRSPMPGTVTSVNVSTGEPVEAGTVLLAVEAMKMEHQLTAAVAGIAHISVGVGSLVKADQVVATIQTATPEGE